jgi:hypothetical protein
VRNPAAEGSATVRLTVTAAAEPALEASTTNDVLGPPLWRLSKRRRGTAGWNPVPDVPNHPDTSTTTWASAEVKMHTVPVPPTAT